MIPNQWYAILESREIPKGRPVGVTRMGEKLVLWRDRQGRVTCQSDLCPHRGVALSYGKLQSLDGEAGGCIQCPFHGFEFDSSGRCTVIPGNGRTAPVPKAIRVRTYATREAFGLVYIWWNPQLENPPADADLPPLPHFDFMADPEMQYSTLKDYWAVHYSRVIENQLDIMHLPFVHHNTIGSGNMTVTNGPRYTVTSGPGGQPTISVWVDTEREHGQVARLASEMPPPGGRYQVAVMLPNLWHNNFGSQMALFIAFVPIDDDNTLLYLRTYQKMVKVPLLKQAFFAISNIGNLVIERQDRRVVVTQRPGRTEMRMAEKLVPGDGPIIAYRRERQALIDVAISIEEI